MSCKMSDDCLVLLSYVSEHRDEPQTYRGLEEATGIPRSTVYHIISEAREGEHSILSQVALEFGYEYYIYKRRGKSSYKKIIDVVRR